MKLALVRQAERRVQDSRCTHGKTCREPFRDILRWNLYLNILT